jgi:NAD-dependent DNA ligase
LTAVLRDGAIDSAERESLSQFFEGFVRYSLARRMKMAREGTAPAPKLSGICAVCPELIFPERIYSFTGASSHATRSRIAELVELCGGSFSRAVTTKVNYLIVGAEGNAAWTYACYGRKVEQAMNLRSEGHQVTIAHESDFWDALQDHGYTKR